MRGCVSCGCCLPNVEDFIEAEPVKLVLRFLAFRHVPSTQKDNNGRTSLSAAMQAGSCRSLGYLATYYNPTCDHRSATLQRQNYAQHYSIKCAATCIHSVRTRHYRYISSVYVPDAPGTRWCEHVSLHIMNTTAYVRPCSLRLVVLYSCLKRYLQREATSFQTTLRWHSTSVVARTSLFTLPLACACIHARACVEQVRF